MWLVFAATNFKHRWRFRPITWSWRRLWAPHQGPKEVEGRLGDVIIVEHGEELSEGTILLWTKPLA